tara:strand:+ start:1160 stop:1606 length:447 start_codon:yes stop_codon:yes gene_type:complete
MATYEDINNGVKTFCDLTIREANFKCKKKLMDSLTHDSYFGKPKESFNTFQLRKLYIKEKLLEHYNFNDNPEFRWKAGSYFSAYIGCWSHGESVIRKPHRTSTHLYENPPNDEFRQHEGMVHDLAKIVMWFNHDQGIELPHNQWFTEL